MSGIKFITFVLLTAGGSFALATILNATKPAAFVECENQRPDGMVGTWRIDHEWTSRENPTSQADPAAASDAALLNQGDTSTITITADTYISNIPQIGTLARPYRIVGGSANRYLLEVSDETGATAAFTVELVPCGLVMETTSGGCFDTLCQNALEEVIRKAIGANGSEDEIQRHVQDAIDGQAQQPHRAAQRVYYRRVAVDRSN